jgi:hypothetical protein
MRSISRRQCHLPQALAGAEYGRSDELDRTNRVVLTQEGSPRACGCSSVSQSPRRPALTLRTFSIHRQICGPNSDSVPTEPAYSMGDFELDVGRFLCPWKRIGVELGGAFNPRVSSTWICNRPRRRRSC